MQSQKKISAAKVKRKSINKKEATNKMNLQPRVFQKLKFLI